MQTLNYPITLEDDENGYKLIRFPDIDWAVTNGCGLDDILNQAQDCLEMALSSMMKNGEPIPTPSPAKGRYTVSPSPSLAMKLMIAISLREQGITQTDLAQRLNTPKPEINRILNPNHPTKIQRLEQALAILGKRVKLSFHETEPA